METMAKEKNPMSFEEFNDIWMISFGQWRCDVMDKYAKDIYPSELVLKKENKDD